MREYLKDLRKARNLTQCQVAKSLGISQNYYSNIENGLKQKALNIWILVKMADCFGVTVDYLIVEEAKILQEKGA